MPCAPFTNGKLNFQFVHLDSDGPPGHPTWRERSPYPKPPPTEKKRRDWRREVPATAFQESAQFQQGEVGAVFVVWSPTATRHRGCFGRTPGQLDRKVNKHLKSQWKIFIFGGQIHPVGVAVLVFESRDRAFPMGTRGMSSRAPPASETGRGGREGGQRVG